MSRVFRRPMFRKGGNVGDGIMTGIVDRENHAIRCRWCRWSNF